MAFSKAKILRFNDIQSCAPPPGAYNPKYKDHVTGALITSSERFLEQSPAKSNASDTQSVGSVKSVPCFRTPTLPRRKKDTSHSDDKRAKTKLFVQPNEALQEKIVECLNKDQTIRDLESQMDEMKLEVSNLKVERQQIVAEKEEIYRRLIETQENYTDKINGLQEEHAAKLSELSIQSSKSDEDNEILKNHYESIKREFEANNAIVIDKLNNARSQLLDNEAKLEKCENRCKLLQNNLLKKCEELSELESRYQSSLEAQAQLQHEYGKNIDGLLRDHQLEIEDLEYEILKIVTESRKDMDGIAQKHKIELSNLEVTKINEMCSLETDYKAQMNVLKTETEAHIRQIEENCTEKIKLSEIQMEETRKELESHWASKLKEQEYKSEGILKECQAISEYSIIQSELEKNELKSNLLEAEQHVGALKSERSDYITENAKLNKTIADLQTDMSGIIIELNDVREKLGNEITAHKRDLSEKRGYEVALNKIHETVNALKNRLLHSDRDVETLKAEIQALEKTTLEIEARCCQLSAELNFVLEENDTLLAEKSEMFHVIEDKVHTIKSELLTKIDVMHQEAEAKISDLNELLTRKQLAFNEVYEQLKAQQKLQLEAQALVGTSRVEIEKLEAENIEQMFEIKRLKGNVKNIQQDNEEFRYAHEQIKGELLNKEAECERLALELEEIKLKPVEDNDLEMADLCKKYIEQSGKYDALQQKHEELLQKNADMERLIAEQNNLIGPFREHLESYERDLSMLLIHKSEAEKEAREMGLKYAEILGHQNHKQKLKHLVDLKKKNIELTESKNDCESKISQQNRIIEKLRQEIAVLTKHSRKSKSFATGDKENVGSPGKNSMLATRIDSPVNPLKERN